METTTENKPKSMLEDLADAKAEIHAKVSGKKDEELPEGSAPIEAKAEEEKAVVAEPEEEEIRILDKTFKTQKEAWAYAEQLEADKLALQAYNQGVKDSIQATAPAAPVVEENFEEEFYKDPKATLAKVQARATNEAIAAIQAETNKEKLWTKFLTKYPDVDREDAERILMKDEIFKNMTDLDKGMDILATKTRSYYQAIADKFKPRTELPKTKAQATSASSGSTSSVTPKTKSEKPLSFSEELKTMRKRA